MKHIILLLSVLVSYGCSSRKSDIDENTNADLSDSIEFAKMLNRTFGEIDSTKIMPSIGCVQGYFALVSPDFVLRIPESIYTENEGCKEYIIGEENFNCALFVFEKDSSNLGNICTDLLIFNKPKPKRRLFGVHGNIKVCMGNKTELWGHEVNKAYIKIINLEFIDSIKRNRKIEVKDRYLWGVMNFGTPG